MYSEIFYVSKEKFKRDFILMIVSYFIIMFLVQFILIKLNIASVVPTESAWDYKGNANLAFIILFLVEFILGFILGLVLVNPYLYYGLMLCSFIIKTILFFLVSGILYSALGIIVIINPSSVISLVTICLGLYLVINGILKTAFSFNLKKITTRWGGALVMGLLTIVLGLLLVINPFGSAVAITKLAGAFLVVVAIFDLVDRYIIMK